jgi:endonuclease-3 related protein
MRQAPQITPLIYDIYKTLFAHYGEQHWWPSKSGEPWEIVAGAVLTQNCAWRNVEKALDNLSALGVSTPHQLLALPPATLQTAIRPAGFFTQKSVYLQEAARFFIAHEAEFSRPCPAEELRARRMRLLGVRGVGRETADSILLYAFKQPVFVIDAYTRRFAERHLAIPHAATLPYDALQTIFTGNLPQEVRIYNEYHALIVRLCKDTCRKQSCACPFAPCNAEGGHV